MNLKEFSDKLFSYDSALIFCHNRPDGDTLGCGLALKAAFAQKGKKADIVCVSDIPLKFGFLLSGVRIFKPNEIEEKYAAHVAVDCSAEMMINDAYSLFVKNTETFNVDHHVSNTKYAKYNYVENTGACCEILYGILKYAGVMTDKYISDCLTLGIVTDTGNFMHGNTTENTLSVAGKLLASGAALHDISYRMFKSQPKSRATLHSRVMSRMKFYENDRVALISILKKDLEECSATSDMTEGFIDFPLSVDGVEVAVSLLENRENSYKISLRSKGRVNVNEIAASFGGGGHDLASGCVICGFYEDVKDKIIRAISLSL